MVDKLPKYKSFSLNDLIEKNRYTSDGFQFEDFDLVHVPEGHSPLVDFHENPVQNILNS